MVKIKLKKCLNIAKTKVSQEHCLLTDLWACTDLEMARHTSSWECDSQQMASTMKLDRPSPIEERRLYLCYKQYSHYGWIKTIWCNDIAQSWKRQKCIFLFCISHQM